MKDINLSNENFFTFQLGRGLFALPVSSVKEVLKYDVITPVPKSLPYLKGVLNIRGSVITVADLRILFGFESVKPIEKNAIIVTEIQQEDDQPLILGILADDVNVVSHLQMVPSETADYGSLPGRNEFVSSVAKNNDTYILILDLEKILTSIKNEIAATAMV
ncbi:MAG: chemotaxis protein CheW [Treponema sp.]|nr:chemotaxis protein CheW [Treponema sp.]